jgi:pseudouridine kinase
VGERVVPPPPDDRAAGDRGLNAPRRVVCAGGAVLDVKYHLRAAPVLATSNPASAGTAFGGVARNVAENLAGLGVPVELVSAIGADTGGAALRAHLVARGVGVDGVRVVPEGSSARYAAVLDPEGDLVLGVAAMDVLDRIDAAQLAAAVLRAPSPWLFVDCNLPAGVLAAALAGGVPVVVDAVSTPKVVRLPADLRAVTVLSGNADEARAWLRHHGHDPIGDDETLAARLHAAGAGGVLLTRGAAGTVVADASGVRRVPAPRIEPVDVTGAGDALVAGTIAALLAGADLTAAVVVGTALAGHTIRSTGTVLPRVPDDVVAALTTISERHSP